LTSRSGTNNSCKVDLVKQQARLAIYPSDQTTEGSQAAKIEPFPFPQFSTAHIEMFGGLGAIGDRPQGLSSRLILP
jgi:hypothetical protein